MMRTCLFVLAALVAGCHWDLNSKSTDPQSDQLYFPAGIAMDPGGQYVYVSNGNADLRYGGGTVMMIDMFSFECTVAAYRLLHPLTASDFAVTLAPGCTALPEHTLDYYQHLAEYNALCYRDRLDPTIVDCDESAFILQNSTVRVGNFAGAIRIAPDASNPPDPLHRTLFVAVRGDPSVTRIDVHLNPNDMSVPGILQCVDDVNKLVQLKMSNPAPVACDATFLVQDYYCESQPTCTVGVNNNGKTQLPPEPFGMVIDSSKAFDAMGKPIATDRRLVVSHLATGQISVIDIDRAPSMALVSESSQFFPPDPTGRHGAFALAQQDPTRTIRRRCWCSTRAPTTPKAASRTTSSPTSSTSARRRRTWACAASWCRARPDRRRSSRRRWSSPASCRASS
ncbi:MAG: hypothetical protein LC659_07355 [Myxococcales bacterium]|nr:hypothetical protein [Myxococcales bacterium]